MFTPSRRAWDVRGEVKKMVAERRRDVKADWSFSCSLSVFVDDFDSTTLTDEEDENALSLRRAFVVLKTRRILFVEVCLFTCIGRREIEMILKDRKFETL